MNIFIGAHYNLNNGDRALLEATLQLVKKYSPECSVTVSAVRPEMLHDSRFNVVGWPLKNKIFQRIWGWLYKDGNKVLSSLFLSFFTSKEYRNALYNADIILISGGHHLTDFLGLDSFYRLASSFTIPLFYGKKVIMLPQSIGPASNKNVIRIIKKALESVQSIAYRDESSKQFLELLNINASYCYVPDLVYSIQINQTPQNDKLVGIALYHSYSGEKRTILDFTIPNLKKVIEHLIQNNYCVKIIPMDKGDEQIYAEIKDSMPDTFRNKFLFGDNCNNILDTVQQFRETVFSITYKTHSTVFAMIANVPVVAIAYHPKTNEFMSSVGLSEYTINDIEADYETINSKIDLLLNNYTTYKVKEQAGVDQNRKLIYKYFEDIMF